MRFGPLDIVYTGRPWLLRVYRRDANAPAVFDAYVGPFVVFWWRRGRGGAS